MIDQLRSVIRSNWKTSLSVCFVLIAVIDTFVAQISTVAATFLGLAALPWLMGLFDKITLPGGMELDLKKIEDQINAETVEVNDEDREAFQFLELTDPNLAMATLRIEIERRLRRMSDARNLNHGRSQNSILGLLRVLEVEGAIGSSVVSMIEDMLPTLNAAVHGFDPPEDSGQWVLANGPKLLSLLDEKM